MKRGIHIVFLVLLMVLSSCQWMERKRQAGAVAELEGQCLYQPELDELVVGLSSEDSARVVEQYIRQWAMDILEYSEARDKENAHIEALVEDYRRSLYVHEYEERLINRRMPRKVDPEQVKTFYEEHKDQLILRESIVKGILMVLPTDAPQQDKLLKYMHNPTDENLEKMEKYAYQYATGYELFMDEWRMAGQLLVNMPFEKNDLREKLRQQSQIVERDSLNTYILQVTDKKIAGEVMPLDFASVEIEKIILSQRQVDFLKQEREVLYEEALHSGRLKR